MIKYVKEICKVTILSKGENIMSRTIKNLISLMIVCGVIFSGAAYALTVNDIILAATRLPTKTKNNTSANTKTTKKATTTKTTTTTTSTANSNFVQKGNKFLSDIRWRPGTVFNGKQKPKLSKYGCMGCCAYAADFVKYVFNKESPRDGVLYKKINEIRKGDVIVVTGPSHWIIVVGRNGNSLNTVEGNWTGGKVDRQNGAYTITNGKLYRNGKPFRTFSYGYHFM